MTRLAIIGSSFIKRLGEFTGGEMDIAGITRFFGKGGMRSNSIPSYMLDGLRKFKPTVSVVLLGGNDVTVACSPAEIAKNLLELKTTLERLGSLVIFVAIPCRGGDFRHSPGLDFARFDKMRKAINRLLSRRASLVHIKLVFPLHFLPDGVHFNILGTRRLYHTIRSAVLGVL